MMGAPRPHPSPGRWPPFYVLAQVKHWQKV
jgi:hypothetical protein